jgi:hypothetical protein
MNNILDKIRKERLIRIENNLRTLGCEKCSVCNIFMDKEYLNKNNVCGVCLLPEKGGLHV